MDEKKRKLLIIIAVVACVGVVGLFLLGIVAGIAIPAWLSQARRAHDAAAISTLNTLTTEERAYRREHGSYATFDQLIEDGALDKRFAGESPTVEGYTFTLKVTPESRGVTPAFSVNADPQRNEGVGATGRRHFYTDSASGEIHYNEGQPATAADPVLEAK